MAGARQQIDGRASSQQVRFHEYGLPGLKTENGNAVQADGTKAASFIDTEGNILAIDQMPA